MNCGFELLVTIQLGRGCGCVDHMMLVGMSQMQRTICEHKDKGAAGGVFKSYEILEVRVSML